MNLPRVVCLILLVSASFAAFAHDGEKPQKRLSVEDEIGALLDDDVHCADWELLLKAQAAPFGEREISGFVIRDVRNDSLFIQQGKDVVVVPIAAIEIISFRETRAEAIPMFVSLAAGIGLGFAGGALDEPASEGSGLLFSKEESSKKPLWVGGGAVAGTLVGALIARRSGVHEVSMYDEASAAAMTELLQRHIQPEKRAGIPWPPNLAFGVRAGLSIPTGSYAETTGEQSGSASVGYSLGADLNMQLGRINSWYTSAMYTRSQVDAASLSALLPGAIVEAGSWSQFWLLSGIRFHGYDRPTEGLHASLQVGAFFGSSPDARMTRDTLSASQSSSNAVTFAGCCGVGYVFAPVHVGLQYAFAQPEYDVTAVRPDRIVVRRTFKQPTTLLSIFVGVML